MKKNFNFQLQSVQYSVYVFLEILKLVKNSENSVNFSQFQDTFTQKHRKQSPHNTLVFS